MLSLGAKVISALAGGSALPAAQALQPLGPAAALLWTLIGGAALAAWRLSARSGPTWDCGYATPAPRMQYTARAFARLGEQLLPASIGARIHRHHHPKGPLPLPSRLSVTIPEPVLERVYLPTFRAIAERCVRLRRRQQGKVHLYVGYIGVVLTLGLAWATLAPGVSP